MKRVRIAFLGGTYPSDVSRIQGNSHGSLDYAADSYQRKYISCINNQGNNNITVFSRMFVGSWPINYNKMYISEQSIEENIEFIKFSNIFGIKPISQIINTIDAIKKWYTTRQLNDIPILFVYSSNFSSEIIKLKKVCPEMKIVLIVPDLPKFTYLSDNHFLRTLLRSFRQHHFENSCKSVNSCICITNAMREYIQKKTSVVCHVIEAIPDVPRCENNLKRLQLLDKEPDKFIFLYSGTLALKYGIHELLQAFKLIDSDCELHICGGGDAEELVRLSSEEDNRIKYFGILSNDQTKVKQCEASVLINPRKPDVYTEFSFPSKIMEYLETGNIVISYKLVGIPDDYDSLLLFPLGNDIVSLSETMKKARAISWEERRKKGRENLNYLLNTKHASKISEIIDLCIR